MNINTALLLNFLRERFAKKDASAGDDSWLASPMFDMIMRGEAKLPLERVEEVALALGCDPRQLARLALHQFYDAATLMLFEKMLADPLTGAERIWLQELRSVANGPVPAPNSLAKRLVRALVQAQSAE